MGRETAADDALVRGKERKVVAGDQKVADEGTVMDWSMGRTAGGDENMVGGDEGSADGNGNGDSADGDGDEDSADGDGDMAGGNGDMAGGSGDAAGGYTMKVGVENGGDIVGGDTDSMDRVNKTVGVT